jgi:transposase
LERKKIIEIYNQGPDAVVNLVNGIIDAFTKEISDLKETIKKQESRIRSLEDKLSKNSSNSHKPPSSDGLRKKTKRTKSLRKKSRRKQGGQKGHKGTTLEFSDNPDKFEYHQVSTCPDCNISLENEKAVSEESRQVIDIEPIKFKTVEHVIETKHCPCCGKIVNARFPDYMSKKVQYGPEIKSIIVYLSQYQLLPYERISELINDIFGKNISCGTLFNTNKQCYNKLEETEKRIFENLLNAKINHFDETGIRCEANTMWLHTITNELLTYYYCHQKRGGIAMDDIGFLKDYKGIAVHDFFKSYLNYLCEHAFCNAHILRELIFTFERFEQKWAKNLIDLLLEIKTEVEKSKSKGRRRFYLSKIHRYEKKYKKIVNKGLKENPEIIKRTTKRGRIQQTPARNLLLRLYHYRKEILSFMYDFDIPFDNNLAERTLRMTKVQQKISGCFRSIEGARIFCRIRGFISTAKKRSYNILDAIKLSFTSNPLYILYDTI